MPLSFWDVFLNCSNSNCSRREDIALRYKAYLYFAVIGASSLGKIATATHAPLKPEYEVVLVLSAEPCRGENPPHSRRSELNHGQSGRQTASERRDEREELDTQRVRNQHGNCWDGRRR